MATQPQRIPFCFGRGVNDRTHPHRVDRPAGTDLWILEFTVSGKGWVRCDGKRTLVKAGDMVLFRAGVPQDYGMDPELGAWNHLWVCFTPRPTWLDWLNWPELGPGVLRLAIPGGDLRRRIQRGLEEALALTRSSLKRRMEFGLNSLEKILLWCDTVNPNSAQARLDPRIRRVLEAVCRQYARPWSLAHQARVACFSPSRFAHLFKAQIGQSPQKWVEAYRVTRATELLSLTGKTVKEVAMETGFNDAFYFSRVFCRQQGVSPRMYRRQIGHSGEFNPNPKPT